MKRVAMQLPEDQAAGAVSPLTLEFLTWVDSRRRTYADAMEAWQSHCPRHTIWEDAVADRLIQVQRQGPSQEPRQGILSEAEVILTQLGSATLASALEGPGGSAGPT